MQLVIISSNCANDICLIFNRWINSVLRILNQNSTSRLSKEFAMHDIDF